MSNNLQGILWAFVATALFAIALAMVKIAVVDFHVLQILFIPQVIVLASALRLGEASVVGNMEYSKLIYAVLIGYLVFAEIPDLPTIAGALIIITAALTLLHRETLEQHSAA